MKDTRKIREIFKSQPAIEGAGVHLRRAFGFDEVPLFDPFLMLDDFRGDKPEQYVKGFPWHPHRGIETITYMLHGEVEHGDSLASSTRRCREATRAAGWGAFSSGPTFPRPKR